MVKWRRQSEKDLGDPLHRWLTWFDKKSPPELIEEVLSMDTAIKKAYEVFGFASQQELNEWDLERRREKASFDMGSRLSGARREGEEIGRQEGQQIGQKEKAIEIARKMKEMGDPIERIHTITGLPTETIERM
jgi:predicted transposase/invertase (TIGR01784 family)